MFDDTFYMKRAITLATKGTGRTSPNPLVGTVIVKNGKIIGEGFHRCYGEKHAEIAAIENASESVEGATLYCNLEPCSDNIPNKKTPSCTNRIIKEKLARVVIANRDPNPYVNGNSVRTLRQHGIEVDEGIMLNEAAVLNEKYFKFIQSGAPFVLLKIAQSLDGRIATMTGNSQWITNENALQMVHKMRAEFDAVLVGANTVLKDNPSLTVRMVEGSNPYRIVLDDHLIIPDNAKLIADEQQNKTIIFTVQSPDHPRFKELENRDLQIFSVEANAGGHVDLHTVLKKLAKMNIISLMVEGGGKVFTSFVKEKLFDKVTFFIAPLIIGDGVESIGDLNIQNLTEALRLENVEIEIIDQQVIMQGYKNFQSLFHNVRSTADVYRDY